MGKTLIFNFENPDFINSRNPINSYLDSIISMKNSIKTFCGDRTNGRF